MHVLKYAFVSLRDLCLHDLCLFLCLSGISIESSPDLTDNFEPFKLTPPPESVTPKISDSTDVSDKQVPFTEMRPVLDTVRPDMNTLRPVIDIVQPDIDTAQPVMRPDIETVDVQKSLKRIPRPMNAFMCWAQYERKRVTALKPGLLNPEISKILGTRWKMLDPKEKQQYVKQAARLKDLHDQKYPGYKYQPRRKQRTTKVLIFWWLFQASTEC